MGYMRHHAIVVTGYSDYSGKINEAHAMAKHIFAETEAHVSEITPVAVNGYQSFLVAPDGSKEGWDTSDAGDGARKRYIEHLRELGGTEWVEVQFGDDERQTRIVDHSDYFPDEEDE